MTSMMRRKRSILLKAVFVIPALWFVVVLVMAYRDRSESQDVAFMKRVQFGQPDVPGYDGDAVKNEEIAEKIGKLEERLRILKMGKNALRKNDDVQINKGDNDNDFDNVHGDKDYGERERKEEENLRIADEKWRKEEEERKAKEDKLKFVPQVREPVDPDAPGENGRAVIIKENELSREEKAEYERGWQNNAFNEFASKKISLHRSLPDVRDAECKTIQYSQTLPDTSVIICFHNEAWSVLLRTVHSVLDRSPPHLIREIILVDDFSDMDHLFKPLYDYVAKLRNVRVVRSKKREGLIRARLLGYSNAVGDVLVFLDSHCECAEGWLEPLLGRIKENRQASVVPIIEIITDDNFELRGSRIEDIQIGKFDWNLQYNWMVIPKKKKVPTATLR